MRFHQTPSGVRCLMKFNWWKSYLVVFRIQAAQRDRKIMTDFSCAAYSPACGHRVSGVWLPAAHRISGKWCDLSCFRAEQLRQAPASPMGALSEQYVRIQATKPRRKILSSLFYAPYFPERRPFRKVEEASVQLPSNHTRRQRSVFDTLLGGLTVPSHFKEGYVDLSSIRLMSCFWYIWCQIVLIVLGLFLPNCQFALHDSCIQYANIKDIQHYSHKIKPYSCKCITLLS